MRFTEQRDTTKRRTLRQSAMALPKNHGELTLAVLYGGTNVIQTRTVLEGIFKGHYNGCKSDSSHVSIVVKSLDLARKLIKERFMRAVCDSFALGMLHFKGETIYEGGRCSVGFVNDVIMASLPEEDGRFCKELIDQATRRQ